MKIERFEDIESWQLGQKLTKAIYAASKKAAFSKDWALKDQVRRASGSVMHNVAEGFDSGTNAEFIRFLGYSKRSCTEVQSQLYVALDQDYVTEDEFKELYDLARLIRSKIGSFIKYLAAYEQKNRGTRRVREVPEDINYSTEHKDNQPGTENWEPGTTCGARE